MSDQNKNTSTAQPDTMNKPALADTNSANPSKEQAAPMAPDHEQGREHTPNVDAQKDAADSRRKEEQAQVPTANADNAAKQNDSTKDRKDNSEATTGQADDAKRTVAEGQGDRKPANDPATPSSNPNTSGNR